MKKLLSQLTANNKQIKATRANRIVTMLDMAHVQLANKLTTEVMQLEAKIEAHMDLSPSHTTSLEFENVGDADKWVQDLQNMKVRLRLKQVEQEIAMETTIELFEEEA